MEKARAGRVPGKNGIWIPIRQLGQLGGWGWGSPFPFPFWFIWWKGECCCHSTQVEVRG